MRGLVLERGSATFRSDLRAPEPNPGETRVRVLRAGVCATDLALLAGYMGFAGVAGHEFCGVALDGPLEGRRVVGGINAGCGRCERCANGLDRHCAHRSVLGILDRSGAFADELSLPTSNLLAVPDAVTTDAATFTEPLAAAFEIPAEIDLVPGTRALVCGDGRLGLLCAHVLARSGLEVVVAGRHAERARLLPEGAQHVTGLLEEEGDQRPAFELAVEATGDPNVLARALQTVLPRGTLVLKTTSERPATLDLAPLVVDEIRLVGSRCGPFEPALEALADGTIPVEEMVEARYPLEEGAAALARAGEPGTLKVLIDVEEE